MPYKNQDKINKLKRFDQDKDLAMFDEMQDIAEGIKNFKNIELIKIKGDTGEKGDNIKGDKGETGKSGKDGKDAKKAKDGKTPTEEELKSIIKPLIPEPIKGEKGDIGNSGKDGNIKDLSPDEIRDALELLQGDERLDITSIKGLSKVIKEIK